ncbi:hypothetical protein [Planomonospora sphaerica]|uniref:hypothetical protein n=1 Tax=Planomonospora sphaerica TaxID=161355 RepID=UPI0012F82782|nr:hypothetical protein [Planomonospora sphaerica]
MVVLSGQHRGRDPAVQAAYAYLAGRGDAFEHLTAAREKLGADAPRDEVVILAAELART